MWIKEDWVSHSIEETETSFIYAIVHEFMRKLADGEKMELQEISEIDVAKNETVAGKANVTIFFKTGEINHVLYIRGFVTDAYKKFSKETWELLLNMAFSPARITPYGFDYVLQLLKKVMPKSITFGDCYYYCAECEEKFQTMKEFVEHLRETNHDDPMKFWFPDFFEPQTVTTS